MNNDAECREVWTMSEREIMMTVDSVSELWITVNVPGQARVRTLSWADLRGAGARTNAPELAALYLPLLRQARAMAVAKGLCDWYMVWNARYYGDDELYVVAGSQAWTSTQVPSARGAPSSVRRLDPDETHEYRLERERIAKQAGDIR